MSLISTTQLHEMVRSGVFPVIEITNAMVEDGETDLDYGMRVRVIETTTEHDDVIRVKFNFREFWDINQSLQQANYFDPNGNPTLKWEESKNFPPNGIDTIYFMMGNDPIINVVETSKHYGDYMKSGFTGTYVSWLEDERSGLLDQRAM